ncbi:EscV/YscV/HrcV family type III secretion system export apparatus protein [Salmonella enterica subsp. enterica serovar Typhimurium]|nr:EscV/YscV/HrcV family type III secretion system export apparatus protein [Salmonella enterica subsp. enterica serovar Typhimurium]
MDWDLITERNIQLFIQLAGLAERPLATNMFWRQGQYETYLNYHNGRIHLCQILKQTFLDEELLFKALANWKPAAFQGIPQRLFLLRDAGRQDMVLATVLLIAIVMMLLPLPTWMVDILITINLMFSVILLLIAIYLSDPLDLSVFPSLLLITTLYRLSLTISTSRLVLLQHNAGNIVDAFGKFVVGGNLTVGLVVFTIITIVQFIVITKGIERVAEVSARFSLDGMPGKQMSIDGDLRAGVIDADHARTLRQHVQQESRFLGAMDGAMKFVKGDTIAGIIVVLVNIIGGIIIAIVQYDMSMSEAVHTYSVLSIGDGLCGQIPSLLISLSAGIIVTRVPGEKRQNLATELSSQIARQPQSLILTAVVLMLLALIPGFPFITLAFFSALLALPIILIRRKKSVVSANGVEAPEKDSMVPGACPLILRLSPTLHSADLIRDIDAMRWFLFEDTGVPLPEVNIEVLPEPTEKLTVLLYQEPVFSLSIPAQADYLLIGADASVVGDSQTLPNGMGQICWLTKDMAHKAQGFGLDVFAGSQRISALLKCVLLRHSIRDLRLIFGTLIDWAPREKDVLMLTEYVRIALRRHILRRLNPEGKPLPILRIGEGIENLVRESIRQTAMGTYTALSSRHKTQILQLIEQALKQSAKLFIVTSVDTRRFLRKITEATLFDVPILSWQELGEESLIQVVESIDLSEEELADNEE